MYLYQIWLCFSDKKNVAFCLFFPVESAEDYFSVLLKYFRREKASEKRRGGGKPQYFLTVSVS